MRPLNFPYLCYWGPTSSTCFHKSLCQGKAKSSSTAGDQEGFSEQVEIREALAADIGLPREAISYRIPSWRHGSIGCALL